MKARIFLTALATALPFAVQAQTGIAESHGPNWIAIGMSLLIVAVTPVITYRSAGANEIQSRIPHSGP